MIGGIDDDTDALRFDPRLGVVKMHAPREELVPFRNIGRMIGVLVVAAVRGDRSHELPGVKPMVAAERFRIE